MHVAEEISMSEWVWIHSGPVKHQETAVLQDFPYNFEEGMEHHNIWSTIPLSKEEVFKVCG